MKHIAHLMRVSLLILLGTLLFAPHTLQPVFAPFAPSPDVAMYTQNSLAMLTAQHLILVFSSLLISVVFGVGAGVFATRPSGRPFLPLSRAIANIGQTFPPVAVLALAISAVGFGFYPALIALSLYGLLPIFEHTVTGIEQTSPLVINAAQGMGMTPAQQLYRVELPLALPLIIEGIKTATVINIGTATIGATVAAKCLGEVIIAGLQINNTAYVLQGGLMVGLIAVLIYDAIGWLQKRLTPQMSQE
jgi:osmoprotectant transport system permease protein